MNAIAKACYSGTLMRDLEAAAERILRHNAIPCECGFALGQHSHIGRRCPDPNGYWRNRTFKELRCEATVDDRQCEAPVKPGQRMCEEHFVE
jgi:hypothetical protein